MRKIERNAIALGRHQLPNARLRCGIERRKRWRQDRTVVGLDVAAACVLAMASIRVQLVANAALAAIAAVRVDARVLAAVIGLGALVEFWGKKR